MAAQFLVVMPEAVLRQWRCEHAMAPGWDDLLGVPGVVVLPEFWPAFTEWARARGLTLAQLDPAGETRLFVAKRKPRRWRQLLRALAQGW